MASLAEIQAIVERIHQDLPALINRSKIAPKQITIINGLSDMSERLGLVQAGEFRSGNGLEPGFGFSGIRIGYPAFSYGGELWNIVGVENDALQVGIRASDGKLVFGGGDGFADQFGLFFLNQEGFLGFQSLTTGFFDDVGMYIDGEDNLSLVNSVGGKSIRFLLDDVSHNVKQYYFSPTAMAIPGNLELDPGGTILLSNVYPLQNGWWPVSHTWTRTGDHVFTISGGDYTDTYRRGTKVTYQDNAIQEYGIVATSSHNGGTNVTTVTLFTNTDYAMSAAGPITEPFVSYVEYPSGFPGWLNFDPQETGFTLGNGTETARFTANMDGFVDYEIAWDLGSTSSVTGSISFVPPATPAATAGSRTPVGIITLLDAGVFSYAGVVLNVSGTAFGLRAFDASTTYLRQTFLSGTVPFTWGTGDGIHLSGRYQF